MSCCTNVNWDQFKFPFKLQQNVKDKTVESVTVSDFVLGFVIQRFSCKPRNSFKMSHLRILVQNVPGVICKYAHRILTDGYQAIVVLTINIQVQMGSFVCKKKVYK